MNEHDTRPLSQAAFHLSLVKKRILSIRRAVSALENSDPSFDYILNLDHAFLDIRKVIEELMLLSVCAHDHAKAELSAKLRKEWHAERIMRHLEKINPRFFPDAIVVEPTTEPGIAGKFVESTEDYLKQDFAADIYNYCGDVLHASNKPLDPLNLARRFDKARLFDIKARNLLKTFELDISGKGWMVLGQLHADDPAIPPELFSVGTQCNLSATNRGR